MEERGLGRNRHPNWGVKGNQTVMAHLQMENSHKSEVLSVCEFVCVCGGGVIGSSISIYEGNLVIFTKNLNGCCLWSINSTFTLKEKRHNTICKAST